MRKSKLVSITSVPVRNTRKYIDKVVGQICDSMSSVPSNMAQEYSNVPYKLYLSIKKRIQCTYNIAYSKEGNGKMWVWKGFDITIED